MLRLPLFSQGFVERRKYDRAALFDLLNVLDRGVVLLDELHHAVVAEAVSPYRHPEEGVVLPDHGLLGKLLPAFRTIGRWSRPPGVV